MSGFIARLGRFLGWSKHCLQNGWARVSSFVGWSYSAFARKCLHVKFHCDQAVAWIKRWPFRIRYLWVALFLFAILAKNISSSLFKERGIQREESLFSRISFSIILLLALVRAASAISVFGPSTVERFNNIDLTSDNPYSFKPMMREWLQMQRDYFCAMELGLTGGDLIRYLWQRCALRDYSANSDFRHAALSPEALNKIRSQFFFVIAKQVKLDIVDVEGEKLSKQEINQRIKKMIADDLSHYNEAMKHGNFSILNVYHPNYQSPANDPIHNDSDMDSSTLSLDLDDVSQPPTNFLPHHSLFHARLLSADAVGNDFDTLLMQNVPEALQAENKGEECLSKQAKYEITLNCHYLFERLLRENFIAEGERATDCFARLQQSSRLYRYYRAFATDSVENINGVKSFFDMTLQAFLQKEIESSCNEDCVQRNQSSAQRRQERVLLLENLYNAYITETEAANDPSDSAVKMVRPPISLNGLSEISHKGDMTLSTLKRFFSHNAINLDDVQLIAEEASHKKSKTLLPEYLYKVAKACHEVRDVVSRFCEDLSEDQIKQIKAIFDEQKTLCEEDPSRGFSFIERLFSRTERLVESSEHLNANCKFSSARRLYKIAQKFLGRFSEASDAEYFYQNVLASIEDEMNREVEIIDNKFTSRSSGITLVRNFHGESEQLSALEYRKNGDKILYSSFSAKQSDGDSDFTSELIRARITNNLLKPIQDPSSHFDSEYSIFDYLPTSLREQLNAKKARQLRRQREAHYLRHLKKIAAASRHMQRMRYFHNEKVRKKSDDEVKGKNEKDRNRGEIDKEIFNREINELCRSYPEYCADLNIIMRLAANKQERDIELMAYEVDRFSPKKVDKKKGIVKTLLTNSHKQDESKYNDLHSRWEKAFLFFGKFIAWVNLFVFTGLAIYGASTLTFLIPLGLVIPLAIVAGLFAFITSYSWTKPKIEAIFSLLGRKISQDFFYFKRAMQADNKPKTKLVVLSTLVLGLSVITAPLLYYSTLKNIAKILSLFGLGGVGGALLPVILSITLVALASLASIAMLYKQLGKFVNETNFNLIDNYRKARDDKKVGRWICAIIVGVLLALVSSAISAAGDWLGLDVFIPHGTVIIAMACFSLLANFIFNTKDTFNACLKTFDKGIKAFVKLFNIKNTAILKFLGIKKEAIIPHKPLSSTYLQAVLLTQQAKQNPLAPNSIEPQGNIEHREARENFQPNLDSEKVHKRIFHEGTPAAATTDSRGMPMDPLNGNSTSPSGSPEETSKKRSTPFEEAAAGGMAAAIYPRSPNKQKPRGRTESGGSNDSNTSSLDDAAASGEAPRVVAVQ